MFSLENICIENSSKNSLIARNIVSSANGRNISYIDSSDDILAQILKSDEPIRKSKGNLLVTENKGSFLKKCTGTMGMICCNYYFLNFATNCPLDCSYCILQEYLANNPILKIFSNTEVMLKELDSIIEATPDKFFRIGTGELTDSLAFDNLTGFSKIIVPFFARMENAILELKTKTNQIKNLLNLEHRGKTVVAWSLNPQRIIDSEEAYSATLEERIDSAACLGEKGYKIAFHFDPIILYEGWEKEYEEVVRRIFRNINPNSICWISLGCLRFSPKMKSIIKERFEKNMLLSGEMVLCADGKLRYFKPLRVDAFKKMVLCIRNNGNNIPIYLCMEGRDVWKKVFGTTPQMIRNLRNIF